MDLTVKPVLLSGLFQSEAFTRTPQLVILPSSRLSESVTESLVSDTTLIENFGVEAAKAETSIATVTPTTKETERTTDRIFAILFIVITNFSFK